MIPQPQIAVLFTTRRAIFEVLKNCYKVKGACALFIDYLSEINLVKIKVHMFRRVHTARRTRLEFEHQTTGTICFTCTVQTYI